MSKLLRMTSLVATVAALALTAAPAAAAPVSATADATARVRILSPLSLTSTQNFDLGDIVLSGTGPFSTTVSLSQAGSRTCDATVVTCSGTPSVALYTVYGTDNQSVTISAPNVTLTNANGGPNLTLRTSNSSGVAYYPTTVAFGTDGTEGVEFAIGGEITVADTTPDGLYTGTFAVTADYQ
jgi:hypothetical protein